MVSASGDHLLIAVRVQPRASRTEIVGERDGRLLVRDNAPPLQGRANDAVCKVVARALGVAPGRAAVVNGARARDKTVRVSQRLDPAEVTRLLAAAPGAPSGRRSQSTESTQPPTAAPARARPDAGR
jgi:uncharacterized protein (TIGR00251 family)